ncbi:MAG: ABC transporter permease [Myxococcota bacterium]
MTAPALLDWRSWAVLRRNALVYLRNWRTAFLPPAFEPLVFFVALGLGLSGYVGAIDYGGRSIGYPTYVAAGILSYTCFTTPYFEGLYSAYVRMFYQKTWDGILATQVELHHILWGEILWAGVRGMMNAFVVAAVLGAVHAAGLVEIRWWWLPLLPPIGMVAGWTFAALSLIFTAIVPSIDHMNYPVFLIGLPLSLVSNTYFPMPTQYEAVRVLAVLNPVYHLSETYRSALVGGDVLGHLVALLVTAAAYLAVLSGIAQRLMRRRVLGE